MSLDLESRLKAFLASAPQTIWTIQTLEISHSAMSRVYHLWREPYAGVAGGADMQMANFEVKLAGSEGHLDQRFDIRLGLADVDDIFREELDRIPLDSSEKIKIFYREFLSDDLVVAQAVAALQVESISYEVGAASLSAVSPRLNVQRTGELYDMKSTPMLRGFI